MTRRCLGGERGSATVWVLALAGLLVLIGGAVVLVSGAVVARHRATTAADMAALAGAGRAVLGDSDPCAAAARIASANDAVTDGCRVRPGAVVEVHVHVAVRVGRLATFAAPARARAGPALPTGEAP